MHTDTSAYSEKVRHGRPFKNCTSGPRNFPVFYVFLNHLAASVYVVAVKAGSMIDILLDYAELTWRRAVTLSASRYY